LFEGLKFSWNLRNQRIILNLFKAATFLIAAPVRNKTLKLLERARDVFMNLISREREMFLIDNIRAREVARNLSLLRPLRRLTIKRRGRVLINQNASALYEPKIIQTLSAISESPVINSNFLWHQPFRFISDNFSSLQLNSSLI